MFINIQKTLAEIQAKLKPDIDLPLKVLHSAYSSVTKLRSQLIAIIYEKENYGKKCRKLSEILSDGEATEDTVTLIINEHLTPMKELTASMHDYWLELIHSAIEKTVQGQKPLYFNKAFVLIEITTPKYSDNARLWDTSNRAVNLVINNLKGIFFKDDNHEHMAFGVIGKWGDEGRTVIKVMAFDRIAKIIDN